MTKTLPKTMTGVFAELAANKAEAKRYVVTKLTKAGTCWKVPRRHLQYLAFSNIHQAVKKAQQMTEMNEGSTYVVLDKKEGGVIGTGV